jgi:glutamate synthase (NADPH) large chain
MKTRRMPEKQGLYDPGFEHDSCGVGFVCDISGKKTHQIVAKGLEVLERMSHRGAVGSDPKTGDGAGILLQMPHRFLAKACQGIGVELPESGSYGCGLVFLPRDENDRLACQDIFSDVAKAEGYTVIGWRDVPVDEAIIGNTARETQPAIRQVFITSQRKPEDQLAFERKLYVIRKMVEFRVRASETVAQKDFFYITNISSRTLIYKGLLMPGQVRRYYTDLKDPSLESGLALVHSRYSTNTFPTWDLAQPFRFLAHNGEINTLRGNINWFRSGERLLASELFGNDIAKIKPVIVEGGSDSATIDNVFELLVLSGRSLEHSMMMLIPSAWEHDSLMDEKLKDFYKFHAAIMEPWDGPAAIAFTDGKNIGAVLDRNGLRPARYIVTKKGMVVMSSEVGVLDIAPSDIKLSGRLEPGKMLFIDTGRGCIVDDSEVKNAISGRRPYGEWLKNNLLDINDIPGMSPKVSPQTDIMPLLKSFGYTREDMDLVLRPMAEEGKEPIGSMGNDTPHAFLSKKTQTLFDYFKQLFAQVTNPAIDPIREELVMSLESFIGTGKNILDESPENCRKLRVCDPILSGEDMAKIREIPGDIFRARTIYTFFDSTGEKDFIRALDRICFEAEFAIEQGYNFIILSDRGVGPGSAALPALLATGAVHHHLVSKAIRSQISIVVESGEPREVNHFALLFGYGADCVSPYLAYEAVELLVKENKVTVPREKALKNYRKAVNTGILKILSKMGISTLRSYRGAQIFEALGVSESVIEKYFTGTVSRVGGITLEGIAKETLKRHREAYPERKVPGPYLLSTGGVYQWKRDGEFHLWRPESIAALQDSVRKEDYSRYVEFAESINDQSKNPTTLRGLLKFKKVEPVPIDEVEPETDILKRFATGAMSFGSISKNAHESIAIAMNRIGGRSNTGEGGEDPARFISLPNGDSAKSAIKQVASGRFGVTTNYLVNADEIQIKVSQGAKPGEGGQLPGHKVSAMIARTRYTTQGVTLISPPPHHDIYSIEDLAQLIFDLKNVNPRARISVKLVSEVGVGTVAAGVAKGHADMILISGADGGTGASPRTSIRHAGLPWELGLSETQQTLVLNDLRSRVRLQTDGQMRTGKDVAVAALLGAEEFGFCTAVLITLGCVMLRHCHLNNCSVGVATQDELLQKRFQGRPEYVVNYMNFIARDLREIMSSLGVRKVDDLIGRTDLLEVSGDIVPEKAKGIDFSRILYAPPVPPGVDTRCTMKQDHGIDVALDRELIRLSKKAVENAEKVEIALGIKNYNRTTGAMLSGRICEHRGERGLPEDTIKCSFTGFAGQSFGAFLARGVTFELNGMANDYVGKGISGGKIIIYPGEGSTYKAEDNIIIGNTCFYGAIAGEAYIRGVAGERFCIRNSGIYAVVEGVGDHGCEYMTGGRVVILGRVGKNFAAGMSGGIAYVYDILGDFKRKCNMEMVEVESPDGEDRAVIYNLIHNHTQYTRSDIGDHILGDFDKSIKKFLKVIPVEYKRVLGAKAMEEKMGLDEVSDG